MQGVHRISGRCSDRRRLRLSRSGRSWRAATRWRSSTSRRCIIVLGGTRRRAARVARAWTTSKRIPKLRSSRFGRRRRRTCTAASTQIVGSPRRRAATACSRWRTQLERRSTTSSPSKGLQLVVDGTDPDLVARHPRVRDRRHGGSATRGTRSCSTTPAASPRRSASSAPSSRSCTCSRTSPNPAPLGPRSPARSSRRCTASARPTSSSCRSATA